MTPSAGTRLGPYEISAPLGAGGMGEVYRATDTRLGRDVAIKVLPRHFLGDRERKARFEREARTLATLNHPGIAAIAVFAWAAVSRSRKAAFVAEALARLERLAREGQYQQAFRLASDVERVAGAGAVSETLWKAFSYTLPVDSQPPGARVSYRRFDRADAWTHLGVAPLSSVRVPQGPLNWRAEMDLYAPADRITSSPGKSLSFELRKSDAPDPEMVLVPGGEIELWVLGGVLAERSVKLDAFLIDRHEITNREFARFVAAGGYARPEFWVEEFRDGGCALSFADAMGRFRDPTGRLVLRHGSSGTSGRRGRPAGGGPQLVRSRRLRAIRRQGAPDSLPLVLGRHRGRYSTPPGAHASGGEFRGELAAPVEGRAGARRPRCPRRIR